MGWITCTPTADWPYYHYWGPINNLQAGLEPHLPSALAGINSINGVFNQAQNPASTAGRQPSGNVDTNNPSNGQNDATATAGDGSGCRQSNDWSVAPAGQFNTQQETNNNNNKNNWDNNNDVTAGAQNDSNAQNTSDGGDAGNSGQNGGKDWGSPNKNEGQNDGNTPWNNNDTNGDTGNATDDWNTSNEQNGTGNAAPEKAWGGDDSQAAQAADTAAPGSGGHWDSGANQNQAASAEAQAIPNGQNTGQAPVQVHQQPFATPQSSVAPQGVTRMMAGIFNGEPQPLYGPYGAYFGPTSTHSARNKPIAGEEPRYDVPWHLFSVRGSTHQVQPGPGYKYLHKRLSPEYLESLEEPYARFVFKYGTSGESINFSLVLPRCSAVMLSQYFNGSN